MIGGTCSGPEVRSRTRVLGILTVALLCVQELARLWDWQHRRAALGLPPDLPGSSGSSSGSRASSVSAAGADVEAAAAGAKAAEAAPAVAAVTKAETEVAPTVAAAVDEASSSSNISSSSSSSDEEVSIPVEDLANKGGWCITMQQSLKTREVVAL